MKRLLLVAMCALGAVSAFAGEDVRAVLLHLGHNFWCDWYPEGKAPESVTARPDVKRRSQPDLKLRTNDEYWRRATDHAAAMGCNMLVIDLGEGLAYPSHPELGVEGSWSVEKLRAELKRLRAIGLEPIPKLNFSTTHNAWLKQYRRMVSTPTYYKVCEDLIADVCRIFDNPRFVHIGCDEETAVHQANSKRMQFICVRTEDLWWHDFLHLVKTVESHGARAWAWSDYGWDHPEEFVEKCPKSVVLSNWFYDEEDGGFELADNKTGDWKRLNNFYVLEKAGYDQIPCGTTYAGWMRQRHGKNGDDIIGNDVRICRRDLKSGHLLGFMMAAWRPLDTPKMLTEINHATDLFAQALRPSVACVPALRPDRQWWPLVRHGEIIGRLERGEIQTNNTYDLVLVGDSITHRWENPVNGASVYPKLQARYRVLNLGSGGDQTQHVLWRLDHGALGQDYPYTAKVFAVMIGVNNGEGDPDGVARGVKLILERIRTKHPESKIILMPILPCGKQPMKAVRQTVINPILKTYADDKTVFWLDFNDRFVGADGEIKPGLMMPDNLHPIAPGYEIWLDAMCPLVDRLIGKVLGPVGKIHFKPTEEN